MSYRIERARRLVTEDATDYGHLEPIDASYWTLRYLEQLIDDGEGWLTRTVWDAPGWTHLLTCIDGQIYLIVCKYNQAEGN